MCHIFHLTTLTSRKYEQIRNLLSRGFRRINYSTWKVRRNKFETYLRVCVLQHQYENIVGNRIIFSSQKNRVCDFIGDITVNFSWTWSIWNLIFVHKQLLSSRSINCDNENLIKIGNMYLQTIHTVTPKFTLNSCVNRHHFSLSHVVIVSLRIFVPVLGASVWKPHSL